MENGRLAAKFYFYLKEDPNYKSDSGDCDNLSVSLIFTAIETKRVQWMNTSTRPWTKSLSSLSWITISDPSNQPVVSLNTLKWTDKAIWVRKVDHVIPEEGSPKVYTDH